MSYPPCFNSLKEHQDWQTLARRTTKQVDWPCVDCTLDYQQRMHEAGRCQQPEAIVGKTKPRKPKTCPAPFAVAKPATSSGKTPTATPAKSQRSADSARGIAKSSTTKISKRAPKAQAGARIRS